MPNISNAEYNRLKRVDAELQAMREDKLIKPMAKAFAENLGLIVSNMPRDRWPSWVEGAYRHASEKYPVAAELYARRLVR